MPGHTTAAGDPVWYGGGQLAPDLTLPSYGAGGPRPGIKDPCPCMSDRAGRAVLRQEVGRSAAAARSEAAYFTALDRAGSGLVGLAFWWITHRH